MLDDARRAVFGTLALTVVNALKLVLQIAVLPILARILGPSAFGLVALAMPLILLANMISDAGLGNALVRKRDSSDELESTIFWIALGMSLAVAAVVALAAWPISVVMHEPRLAWVIVALTVILPIGGSLSVANARISRDGRFSLFAASDALGCVASSIAAIGAALAGAGPWSLVIQQCVLWIVKAAWLWPTSGFRPMFVCRLSLAAPYVGFGLNTVGANLADFANKNVPTMFIGGLIGVAAAGHYAMAYQIVRIPELVISGPLYLSIFAAVARWGDDRAGSLPLILASFRGVVAVLAPLFCGLALVAHLAVQLLLGDAWAQTAPILVLLAPAGFFLCIYSFIGAVLMGLGRSELQFKLIIFCGVFLGLGTLLGARHGGEGVAAGFSVGAACAAPAFLWVLAKDLHVPVRAIAREALPSLVASLVMAVAVTALLRGLPPWNSAIELGILATSGAGVFALVLVLLSGGRLLRDVRSLFAAGRDAEVELS